MQSTGTSQPQLLRVRLRPWRVPRCAAHVPARFFCSGLLPSSFLSSLRLLAACAIRDILHLPSALPSDNESSRYVLESTRSRFRVRVTLCSTRVLWLSRAHLPPPAAVTHLCSRLILHRRLLPMHVHPLNFAHACHLRATPTDQPARTWHALVRSPKHV